MVLFVCALTAASVMLLADYSLRHDHERQIDEAQRHVLSRIATTDQGWRQAAYALAQQLELWQGGDSSAEVRDARMRLGLANALEQSDFSHALLQGSDGQVLLRLGTRSQAQPILPPGGAPLAWSWSEADQTVYRVIDGGSIRFGERPARLWLFAPIEPSILARMVYPGNALSLRREGRVLAAAGQAGTSANDAPARLALHWDGRPEAPELLVVRQVVPLLSLGQLLGAMAGAASLLLAGGWLVLGRWVRAQSLRVRALQSATTGFDAAMPNPGAAAAIARVAQEPRGPRARSSPT
jgi:hypothetical protein